MKESLKKIFCLSLSHLICGKVPLFIIVLLVNISSFGSGRRPDPIEYQSKLDTVVAEACKKFERYGVHLTPDKLKYGEHEIVDSFLYGRDTYRDSRGRTFPVEEKLEWLAGVLGDKYHDLEIKWRRNVEELKKGVRRLSQKEIELRLNELRDGPLPTVKMSDGGCRSSSGCRAIYVECIHCGKLTIYPNIEENAYVFTPHTYLSRVEKMKQWGLIVSVDGRTACPDCCPFPYNFKLKDFPAFVKVRDDFEMPQKDDPNYHILGSVLPGLEIKVTSINPRGMNGLSYSGSCSYPEAWIHENKTLNYFCLVPGARPLYGYFDKNVQYAEPREVVDVPRRGRFLKILNVRSDYASVPAQYVAEIKHVRSSNHGSIPPVVLTINGHRFGASPNLIDAIEAFIQGYDTVITGTYRDHIPLKRFEPQLRKILVAFQPTP